MDVGGLWGAGKGLLCGATLGIGKGVVAGVDKAYESAAPVVLSSRQQQKVNRRVESAAQACASEMAPEMNGWAAAIILMCPAGAMNRLPVGPHVLAQSKTGRCSSFRHGAPSMVCVPQMTVLSA